MSEKIQNIATFKNIFSSENLALSCIFLERESLNNNKKNLILVGQITKNYLFYLFVSINRQPYSKKLKLFGIRLFLCP